MKIIKQQGAAADGDVLLVIKDAVDDVIDFPKEKFKLSDRIILDCAEVQHVSSLLVKAWLIWLKRFDPRQQFVFRNVPYPMVNTFNILNGFLPPSATVDSFFVAYECEKCGAEDSYLMKRGKDFMEKTTNNPAKIHYPETLNCTKCKSVMKIAVLEKSYFHFLQKEPQN